MSQIFSIPPDLIRGPKADFIPLSGEANWGVEVFDVDALRAITDGAGVTVGVVDTGVDRSHPLLGHVTDARDFTGSPYGPMDRNGHGTHVSGTIGATNPAIGMAPGCRIVHGKALSDEGSGAGQWIADAIQWCVDQGAEIVSMSLGSPMEDQVITRKMAELVSKGVWFVCAAGNSGPNTPNVDWPGRSSACVSVAALNRDKSPASFSSAGAKIDTSFAGVNIWSCAPGGGFQQMSGTSMATPGTAGILALYRAALKIRKLAVPTMAQIRSKLTQDSTDTHTPGIDRRTGPGWITPALLYLDLTPLPKVG